MDIIIASIAVLASIVGSLILLDVAAARWGVDSRPTIGDSHVR